MSSDGESSKRSLVNRYYAQKMASAYSRLDPKKTSWNGNALSGWINRLSGDLDIPFKSVAVFVGSWILLQQGWPLLTVWAVATAGSVWNIPTMIPFVLVATYAILLVSAVNMIRALVTQLGGNQDSLVKALFRGYFWSLLSLGLVLLIHKYFMVNMPLLFIIPVFYLLPIEVTLIGTVPIPIPLGITGIYIQIIVTLIVTVVGIAGGAVGGLEILRTILDGSSRHGRYGSILAVLFLSIYPALNVYFSIVFLDSALTVFRRFLFGA
jgi:hypothetical protein